MTCRIGISLIGLGMVLALANNCLAATIVMIPSDRDTTIYANAVNNSNGSGIQMLTGNSAPTQPRRGLIWFDVAGNVPSGATITSATLTLQLVVSATMGPANTDVVLYRLLADWGEAGSTAGTGSMTGTGVAALTGDATWSSSFFNTTAWGTAGGDFFGTASATQSINKTNGAKTWSSTGTVLDVQGWLDTPALNFGWIVSPATTDTTTQTERRFATREASAELRPVLTLEYTEAQPVPEPAAWTLAAIGLAALNLVGARYRHRRSTGA